MVPGFAVEVSVVLVFARVTVMVVDAVPNPVSPEVVSMPIRVTAGGVERLQPVKATTPPEAVTDVPPVQVSEMPDTATVSVAPLPLVTWLPYGSSTQMTSVKSWPTLTLVGAETNASLVAATCMTVTVVVVAAVRPEEVA